VLIAGEKMPEGSRVGGCDVNVAAAAVYDGTTVKFGLRMGGRTGTKREQRIGHNRGERS